MTRQRGATLPRGAKKARKSTAVILLEKDVTHLRSRVDMIWKVMWGIAAGVGSIIVAGISALINYLLK